MSKVVKPWKWMTPEEQQQLMDQIVREGRTAEVFKAMLDADPELMKKIAEEIINARSSN